MTGRRVLLLGPVFHGYTDAIGDALAARGHEVVRHRYDEKPGTVERLRAKVLDELPERVGVARWDAVQRRATERATAVLHEVRPDLVLGVKADVLTPAFWSAARRAGARTHLWLYDELRRMRLDPDVLPAVDLVSSYSAGDAAALAGRGLPASHVPNGFDTRTPWRAVPSATLLFVGARYPNRERLLVDLAGRGLPVRAVGRDWSRHPVDRLRTWDLRRPAVASGRDVERSQGYGLMAGAAGNLNLHHDQDGFTMRTFEIPGVGGLQLVDRADVDILYDPGTEVAVFGSADEAADLAGRALTDRAWARAVGERAHRRTLAEHTLDHRVDALEALWRA